MATSRDAERILESHLSNIGKQMVRDLIQMNLYIDSRSNVTDIDRVTTHLLQKHFEKSFISSDVKNLLKNALDDKCFDAIQFIEHITLLQPWSTHSMKERYDRIRSIETELLSLVNFDEEGANVQIPTNQDAAIEMFMNIKHRAYSVLKRHLDALLEDGNILFFSPYTLKFLERSSSLSDPIEKVLTKYKQDNDNNMNDVTDIDLQYRRDRYKNADNSANDLTNIDANIIWLSEDDSSLGDLAKEMQDKTGDMTWTEERLQSCVIVSDVAQSMAHETPVKKSSKDHNLGLVDAEGVPWGTPYSKFRLLNLTPDPMISYKASNNALQRLQPFDVMSVVKMLNTLRPPSDNDVSKQSSLQSIVMSVDAHEIYIQGEFKRMSILRHAFLQTRINHEDDKDKDDTDGFGLQMSNLFKTDDINEHSLKNRAMYNSIKQDVECVLYRNCADTLSITTFNDGGRPMKNTWPMLAHMLDYMLLFAIDFYTRATPYSFFDRFIDQIFNIVLASPSIKFEENVESSLSVTADDTSISGSHICSVNPSSDINASSAYLSKKEEAIFDSLCVSSMRFDLCLRSDHFWIIDTTSTAIVDGILPKSAYMSLSEASSKDEDIKNMLEDRTKYKYLPLWRLPKKYIARPKMMENTLPIQHVCKDLLHDTRSVKKSYMYQDMKGSTLRITSLPPFLEQLCRKQLSGTYANIPEAVIMPDIYNSSNRHVEEFDFILPSEEYSNPIRFVNDTVTMYILLSKESDGWADSNWMNGIHMISPEDDDDGYEGEDVRDRGWRMMSKAVSPENIPSLKTFLESRERESMINEEESMSDIRQCFAHVGERVREHLESGVSKHNSSHLNFVIPNFAWKLVTEKIATDAVGTWVDTFIFHKLIWIAIRTRLCRPEVIAHFMQPIRRKFHIENFARNITDLVSTLHLTSLDGIVRDRLATTRNVLSTAGSLFEACSSISNDANQLYDHLSSTQSLVDDMLLHSTAITTTPKDTHDWHLRIQTMLSSRMARAKKENNNELSILDPTKVDVTQLFKITKSSILKNGGTVVQIIMDKLPDVGSVIIKELMWEDTNLSPFYAPGGLCVLDKVYQSWLKSNEVYNSDESFDVDMDNYYNDDILEQTKQWITYALQQSDEINNTSCDLNAWFSIPAPLRYIWMAHWYPHLEIVYINPFYDEEYISDSSESSHTSGTKYISEFRIIPRDRDLLCGDIITTNKCIDEDLMVAPLSIGRIPLILQSDGPLGRLLDTFLSMLKSCASCCENVISTHDDSDDEDHRTSVADSWRFVMKTQLDANAPVDLKLIDQPNHVQKDVSRPDIPGYGMLNSTICESIINHCSEREDILKRYNAAKTRDQLESIYYEHEHLCRKLAHEIGNSVFEENGDISNSIKSQIFVLFTSILSFNSSSSSQLPYTDVTNLLNTSSSKFTEEIKSKMLSTVQSMTSDYFAKITNFATRIINILHYSDPAKRHFPDTLAEFQTRPISIQPPLESLLVASLISNPSCTGQFVINPDNILSSNLIPQEYAKNPHLSTIIRKIANETRKPNMMVGLSGIIGSLKDVFNTYRQ